MSKRRNIKQKKESITVAGEVGKFVAQMSFFLILILLPLYMDKKFYLAMINAKGQCFTVISLIIFLGIFIYATIFFSTGQYKISQKQQISFRCWNMLDFAVLLFGISVVISFLLSADKKMCLWGTGGFRVGTYMVLSLIAIFYFTSRHISGGRRLWDMVFIVADVIFLWLFLNSVSVDILNMHAQIADYQYFDYFASLGQMDIVTAYICLLLPVGIVFYTESKKREDLYFYGSFVFLAILSLLCIQTDGVYIGLAFCCLFLFPYMLSTYGRCVRFLQVGLLIGGALFVVKVLFLLIPHHMKVDTTSVSYNMSRYWVWIPVVLICSGLLYLVKKYNAKLTSKVLKRISTGMVFVDVLIIIGYFLYSLFHFSTGWGNGRGAIWSASVKVFQEYTPLEKLFGLGTDMIRERLTPLVGWNVGVANCHNNILECLLCLGAIGLVAYLFLWIAIVKPWFHKDRILWSAEQTGYFMALIAYFGQSIVGNPYSLTIPMAFMLLTLYRSEQSGRAVTL